MKVRTQLPSNWGNEDLTVTWLQTFVFELEVDYKNFMHEVADKRGIRINGAWLGQNKSLASFPKEFSDDQVRSA